MDQRVNKKCFFSNDRNRWHILLEENMYFTSLAVSQSSVSQKAIRTNDMTKIVRSVVFQNLRILPSLFRGCLNLDFALVLRGVP